MLFRPGAEGERGGLVEVPEERVPRRRLQGFHTVTVGQPGK